MDITTEVGRVRVRGLGYYEMSCSFHSVLCNDKENILPLLNFYNIFICKYITQSPIYNKDFFSS